MRMLLSVLILAPAALAQQWEFGGLAGGGFLSESTVGGSKPAVSAGFNAGPAVGVSISHDLYPRLSGEIRYLFEQSNARLQSGSVSTTFSGHAHVLHYDAVYHLRSIRHPARPYVAAGAGVKIYRATGEEMAYRPLMQYAWLTRATETKPMLSFGGGVKFRLRGRLLFRLDIRDQITPFPKKIITPAPGCTLGGWLHDIVPTMGVSWLLPR